ncbi:hypothetical protein CF327_g6193 [Tilletia walkeri]|nr:hypothetical protein CF327_g6193 [Tilletia walkeri]
MSQGSSDHPLKNFFQQPSTSYATSPYQTDPAGSSTGPASWTFPEHQFVPVVQPRNPTQQSLAQHPVQLQQKPLAQFEQQPPAQFQQQVATNPQPTPG